MALGVRRRRRSNDDTSRNNLHKKHPLKRSSSDAGRTIQRNTYQAVGVLALTILSAVVWNRIEQQHTAADPSVARLLQSIDHHPNLKASQRTLRTRQRIRHQETILTLPRHQLILDVDALSDPFIQQTLLGKPGQSAVVVTNPAAYLAVLFAMGTTNHTRTGTFWMQYDAVLPKRRSSALAFHPVFWSSDDLEQKLGVYTSTFVQVERVKQLLRDEYQGFVQQAGSDRFSARVPFESYQVARLNVMTRSFGTGRATVSHQQAQEYQRLGIDVRQGSYAMVPILDLLNHHAKPHVEFTYTNNDSFVVKAITDIPANVEVFDSYGKRTDSDLFAKFGFVNGDGSEYTEASLALWHRLDKEVDPKRMLKYLQYDDGYEACVGPSHADAWDLKIKKYRRLLEIANQTQHWVIRMPPRDPSSLPAPQSDKPANLVPPRFNMKTLQFDARALFETCRLITLTHTDYNGSLQIDRMLPTRDALEFRTLMCVARMASTALSRFRVSIDDQLETVAQLNVDAFQTPDWTIAHLRLGEMQTLEALKQTAFAGLQTFRDQVDTTPSFTMRNKPCGPEHLQRLMKEAGVKL